MGKLQDIFCLAGVTHYVFRGTLVCCKLSHSFDDVLCCKRVL